MALTKFSTTEEEAKATTSFSDFIPILLAEYSLTPKTQLILGSQGFPFLPARHWDRVNDDGSYGQIDYALMYKMRSEYFGFENEFFLGYLLRDRQYNQLRDRDFKRGTFFVEIISPF